MIKATAQNVGNLLQWESIKSKPGLYKTLSVPAQHSNHVYVTKEGLPLLITEDEIAELITPDFYLYVKCNEIVHIQMFNE